VLSGRPGNEASQAFDPADRSALNKAEYLGGTVFVTAGGSYQPLVRTWACSLMAGLVASRAARSRWLHSSGRRGG
jgi:hypothetical protein